MTATDLCRLASAAFPDLTFEPIDFGCGPVAASSAVRVRPSREGTGYYVAVRGERMDYVGSGPTIEAAHADALACRAEYEPAPTVSAPAQLLLF